MSQPRATSSVTVIMPCLNEAATLDRALDSIRRQTLEPRRVIVADGGSWDGTRSILEDWQNRLPLTVLDNPKRRQAPGLNLCIDESIAPYLARMDGHSTWNPGYLRVLVEALEEEDNLAAAGGGVRLDPGTNRFQRDVWHVMQHRLGTGAPSYRGGEESRHVPSIQSPAYRRRALEECGRFREDLPWAEDDELHHRLRSGGWELRLCPGAVLYYTPRDRLRPFLVQFHHYGRGRGRLGNEAIFPSKRHRRIDQALVLWTLGLAWNPVGWVLGGFYLLLPVILTLDSVRSGWPRLRLLYLFPLMHLSYWLGWVRERSRSLFPRTDSYPVPRGKR